MMPGDDELQLSFWHNSLKCQVSISRGYWKPTYCHCFDGKEPSFGEVKKLIRRLFESYTFEHVSLKRPWYVPTNWEPFERFEEQLRALGFQDPRNNGDKCDTDDAGKKTDSDHEDNSDHEDDCDDEEDTRVLCLTRQSYMLNLAHLCLRRRCRDLPRDAIFRIFDLVRRD